jgi:hypothetical protein
MSKAWTRLVRFLAEEDGQLHLGQVDHAKWPDVGLAIYDGKRVDVQVVTGTVFDGVVTSRVMHISKVAHNSSLLLDGFRLTAFSYCLPSIFLKCPSSAA